MGDDFGVGLAGEGVAPCLEFFPQGGMVLDDAVVDEGDPFSGKVWMGVVGGGGAMGRPAGVGDAECAAEGLDADLFLEFGDTGGAAGALEAPPAVDGDAA